MAVIYSIGHSNLKREVFLELLQKYDIEKLIDVRTKPYSRFSPQYNRNALMGYLADNGITYDFMGANLGGLAENVDYQQAIDMVTAFAMHKNTVVMCSERDPLKCHRHTMLAPDFILKELTVKHILPLDPI